MGCEIDSSGSYDDMLSAGGLLDKANAFSEAAARGVQGVGSPLESGEGF